MPLWSIVISLAYNKCMFTFLLNEYTRKRHNLRPDILISGITEIHFLRPFMKYSADSKNTLINKPTHLRKFAETQTSQTKQKFIRLY